MIEKSFNLFPVAKNKTAAALLLSIAVADVSAVNEFI